MYSHEIIYKIGNDKYGYIKCEFPCMIGLINRVHLNRSSLAIIGDTGFVSFG